MSHKETWACIKPDGDGCDGNHTREVVEAHPTDVPGYKAWKLDNHIVGKVYDLTQANMNAMIADIEKLNQIVTKTNALIDRLEGAVKFYTNNGTLSNTVANEVITQVAKHRSGE